MPGIYQRRISKAYEIRATFFGDAAVTVAIDSQRHLSAAEDWRSAINLTGYLKQSVLPPEVHDQCVAMMRILNLSIACFDFIVDTNGCYWFLELNQQGQFLWVQEQCPDAPMLRKFVEFLVDGAPLVGEHVLADAMNHPSHTYLKERFSRERFVELHAEECLPGGDGGDAIREPQPCRSA